MILAAGVMALQDSRADPDGASKALQSKLTIPRTVQHRSTQTDEGILNS